MSAAEVAEKDNDFKNLNNHLANERTHMAGVRTAISFVSFGVTLNRFSLYLSQSEKDHPNRIRLLNESANTGLGMVVLGFLVLLWALYRYRVVLNAIKMQNYTPPKFTVTMIASLLMCIAIFGVVWMIMG